MGRLNDHHALCLLHLCRACPTCWALYMQDHLMYVSQLDARDFAALPTKYLINLGMHIMGGKHSEEAHSPQQMVCT